MRMDVQACAVAQGFTPAMIAAMDLQISAPPRTGGKALAFVTCTTQTCSTLCLRKKTTLRCSIVHNNSSVHARVCPLNDARAYQYVLVSALSRPPARVSAPDVASPSHSAKANRTRSIVHNSLSVHARVCTARCPYVPTCSDRPARASVPDVYSPTPRPGLPLSSRVHDMQHACMQISPARPAPRRRRRPLRRSHRRRLATTKPPSRRTTSSAALDTLACERIRMHAADSPRAPPPRRPPAAG